MGNSIFSKHQQTDQQPAKQNDGLEEKTVSMEDGLEGEKSASMEEKSVTVEEEEDDEGVIQNNNWSEEFIVIQEKNVPSVESFVHKEEESEPVEEDDNESVIRNNRRSEEFIVIQEKSVPSVESFIQNDEGRASMEEKSVPLQEGVVIHEGVTQNSNWSQESVVIQEKSVPSSAESFIRNEEKGVTAQSVIDNMIREESVIQSNWSDDYMIREESVIANNNWAEESVVIREKSVPSAESFIHKEENSVTAENMIRSFQDIAVGETADSASQFLRATNWNLKEALQLFFIGNHEPGPVVENRYDDNSEGDNLFPAPIALIHKASFEKAKLDAKAADKWLIVNIQSNIEFSSQMLNGHTWANEALAETIRCNFVFWQIYDDREEGQKVSSFYKVESRPMILVIDPITGLQMRAWSGMVEAETLLEDLMPFMDKSPQHTPTSEFKRAILRLHKRH